MFIRSGIIRVTNILNTNLSPIWLISSYGLGNRLVYWGKRSVYELWFALVFPMKHSETHTWSLWVLKFHWGKRSWNTPGNDRNYHSVKSFHHILSFSSVSTVLQDSWTTNENKVDHPALKYWIKIPNLSIYWILIELRFPPLVE